MQKIRRPPAIIARMSRRIPDKIRAKESVEPSETKPIDGPSKANPRRITKLLMDKTVARVEEIQF